MKTRKRFVTLIAIVCFLNVFSTFPAIAAPKCRLVKSYKLVSDHYEDSVDYYLLKFKYNKKKDVVRIDRTMSEYKGKSLYNSCVKFKYKYNKKGQKIKRWCDYGSGKYNQGVTEYKNDIPVKFINPNGVESERYNYTSRYATNIWALYDIIGPKTYTYTVTSKGGYPVRIVQKDNSDSLIVDFYTSGKKRGLVKQIVKEIAGGSLKEIKNYSYKFKKGLLTSSSNKETYITNGKVTLRWKESIKFKYTNTKISSKRYYSMMNDIIANRFGSEFGATTYYAIHTYW